MKLMNLITENSVCDEERKQNDAHDFTLLGQTLLYDLRSVAGCNPRDPQFVLYVKERGPNNAWVQAVKDSNGCWQHPSYVTTSQTIEQID